MPLKKIGQIGKKISLASSTNILFIYKGHWMRGLNKIKIAHAGKKIPLTKTSIKYEYISSTIWFNSAKEYSKKNITQHIALILKSKCF